MKVCKFGGTSMATSEQIRKVCSIITSDKDRRVVVVSAPGKRFDDDIKVTDLLIDCANKYLSNGDYTTVLNQIIDRYAEIAKDLGLNDHIIKDIENNLKTRVSLSYNSAEKFMDRMKAAGEDNAARLVANYMESQGITAQYMNPKDAGLFLSDEYGNARVLSQSFKNLAKLRDIEGIIIFPGFFGYSLSGEVVTFPRGGSDITGSILAAALEVDVYENFTDVDSVFVASPKLINHPKPISVLTYREMRELSYAGFSVLHEETLEPVFQRGVPVNIRNTNNPASPGTMITPTRELINCPIAGIAGDKGFCSININKYMMNREIGFGRKVMQILEEECIPFEHMPSGIDDISIIVRKKYLNDEKKSRIMERIAKELRVDSINLEYDLALVMVVGEGMTFTVGVLSRITKALAENNINIRMVNQGSSEVSIMFGVSEKDADNAIVSIYNEFFN
ncbi:MAG: aspartate kinase [Clostridiaceae bacterium]|mgnify:CR=1 FL=1|jgi:aspartate kinase|nr:aspartate kinase [Clostridiaceae bacterium]